MKKLLTANDVIKITQFSKTKVYRLFTDDPSFKSFKHFGNWRIEEENFLNWLEMITNHEENN